jgi:hypothetical protein
MSVSLSSPTPKVSPSPAVAHYSDNGVSFDYPASWQVRPQNVLRRTGMLFALIGTARSACLAASIGPDCSVDWNLQPGTISVEFVSQESPPLFQPLYEEPIASGSTRLTVGGLPAVKSTSNLGSIGDADAYWAISVPGNPESSYGFMAAAMNPGAQQALEQVDAIVASLQYVPPVEPLPTGAARDAAIARAVTALAAHDQSFSCFPTKVGETTDAVIQYFPAYSKLRKPVPVHCSIAVEETPIEMWKMKLTISWDAANDRKAGTNVDYVWVDATGEPGLETGGGTDAPPYWP